MEPSNPTPSSSYPNSQPFPHHRHHKNSAERYAPQFKAKVLKYLAEGESNQTGNDNSPVAPEHQKVTCKYGMKTIAAAAVKFKVHPTTISDWVHNLKRNSELKKVNQLKKSPRTSTTVNDNDKVSIKLAVKKPKTLPETKRNYQTTQQIVSILLKERLEGQLSKESNLKLLREKLFANLEPLIIAANSHTSTRKTTPWFINWWSRFSKCNNEKVSEIDGNAELNGAVQGANCPDQKRITVSKLKYVN